RRGDGGGGRARGGAPFGGAAAERGAGWSGPGEGRVVTVARACGRYQARGRTWTAAAYARRDAALQALGLPALRSRSLSPLRPPLTPGTPEEFGEHDQHAECGDAERAKHDEVSSRAQ